MQLWKNTALTSVAALLGALDAQLELGAAAIGGKDSMSGSFGGAAGVYGITPDGADGSGPACGKGCL